MRAAHYGLVYTVVLSAAAPGFLLQALGWGPRTLAPAACGAAWAALSAALFAALSWRLWRSGTGRAPRRAPHTLRFEHQGSAYGRSVHGGEAWGGRQWRLPLAAPPEPHSPVRLPPQLAASQLGTGSAVKRVLFFVHCCLQHKVGTGTCLQQGYSLCAETVHVPWCRRTLLMAGVSLCMSAVWLSAVADEVVALLQALGHILGITTVRPALPTHCARSRSA